MLKSTWVTFHSGQNETKESSNFGYLAYKLVVPLLGIDDRSVAECCWLVAQSLIANFDNTLDGVFGLDFSHPVQRFLSNSELASLVPVRRAIAYELAMTLRRHFTLLSPQHGKKDEQLLPWA
jgi:hypothetical protein